MAALQADGLTPGKTPDKAPVIELVSGDDGRARARIWQAGSYALKWSDGRVRPLDIAALPSPLEVTGPWTLDFPKGWGAPEQVRLDTLIDWAQHPDDGVRHFSGTATYHTAFDLPADLPSEGRSLHLDLGRVRVIAQVRLNGHDLGTLWKPPFRVEATQALKPGRNELEIQVTNLWPNRLIGDEALSPDVDYGGPLIAKWPDWLNDPVRRAQRQRLTFATLNAWSKDDALLPSGLIGPVRLLPAEERAVGAND